MVYYVVSGNTPYDLAKDVKDYLERGWELQGGVAADERGVYQAIVKEEEDDE